MEKYFMGLIYADIELINGEDIVMARRRYMDKDEIKRLHINILVDTGSYMLAINENIQEILKLPVTEKKKAQLANGQSVWCDVVAPIQIRFQNRTSNCSALVLPGDAEPLLGAIPMKDMDVMINPLRQQLMVNPESPDYAIMKMK